MPAPSWKTLGRIVTASALMIVLSAIAAADARGARDGWQVQPGGWQVQPGGWTWPVHGQVVTAYSNDNARPYAGGMHRGIDIAAPVGTRVSAARGGLVTYAGALGSSGLTVAVRTPDGYATSYLHLGKVSVARGDRVGAGDRLGEVGTTGRRSKPEPHLHFGVRRADRDHFYLDPLTLLPTLQEGGRGAEPVPAPAPVPARPEPVPARAPVAARPLRAPAAPRLHARPALGAIASVPAGPPARARRELDGRAPHPLARPVPVEQPRPERDWGRLLALGGAVLLFAALFGPGLVRALRDANGALSERLFEGAARVLSAIRAFGLVATRRDSGS